MKQKIAGWSVPVLLVLVFAFATVVRAQTIPTISIVSVTPDDSVTIETANYPANIDFDVRMGLIGTRGVNGFLVDTVNSAGGGKLTFSFDIPFDLQGQEIISIRLESKEGYFSYNWFLNRNPTSPVPTGTVTSAPVPTTTPAPGTPPPTSPGLIIPTITIIGVVQDEQVTIRTANFPANMQFDVRMGKIGTRGIGGELVTTVSSGGGGSFDATFDIPASLTGQDQISIRLDSTAGYFSYNWFWNTPYP